MTGAPTLTGTNQQQPVESTPLGYIGGGVSPFGRLQVDTGVATIVCAVLKAQEPFADCGVDRAEHARGQPRVAIPLGDGDRVLLELTEVGGGWALHCSDACQDSLRLGVVG